MKGRPIDLLKAKTNACTLQDFLGVSRQFVLDTSPKSIDREGLGRRRIVTRAESFRSFQNLFCTSFSRLSNWLVWLWKLLLLV